VRTYTEQLTQTTGSIVELRVVSSNFNFNCLPLLTGMYCPRIWRHLGTSFGEGSLGCNYTPPLRTSESGIWSRREGFRCFWWSHTITRERRKVELNVKISTSRLPGAGVLDADDMQANGLDSLGGGSRRPGQSAVETLSKY
jgi:hypothetical protein